jgi:predicted component of type VI protein secretion system
MDSQSFSICCAEAQDSLFTGSTEAELYTNDTVDNQISPIGFSMDPTVIQQHYNLTTPFGSYTQTPSIDMKPVWPTPRQYADPSSQSPVQQGLPPLVPRLSIAKSLVSDEGDDTSEPTSPRDEASERRKEVSGYFCRFYPSRASSQTDM